MPPGALSSRDACRMIWIPPLIPRPAMIVATIRFGQVVPVPNTPVAATTTATLPIASSREQIQTDRKLASPVRKRYNIIATAPLAMSVTIPTKLIISAYGTVPCQIAPHNILPGWHNIGMPDPRSPGVAVI